MPVPTIWSWVYQYSVGVAIFLFGLYLALRSDSPDMKGKYRVGIILMLIGGFLFYALLHLAFQTVMPRL